MTAIKRPLPVSPGAARTSRPRLPAGLADVGSDPDRLVFGLPFAAGVVAMLVAFATLFVNETDPVNVLVLGLLAVSLALAFAVRRTRSGEIDRATLVMVGLTFVATALVALLPPWLYGGDVNAYVSRTVVSGPLLMVLGVVTTTLAVRRLVGGTPGGQDLAMIPVFLVPIVVGLVGYIVIVGRVAASGIGSFRLDLLTTAWHENTTANGYTYELGFLNNILGTFELIALTLLVAILPGIGAGVFMSEYPGRLAKIMNFCATMLRAIAMFIIGAAAVGIVHWSSTVLDSSSFLSLVIRGGFDDGTRVQPEHGSFVLAAIVLSMLVMPVIARLTEEGLRSVPREIREGAVALGATDGTNLRRILLPWAAPNILTAMILGGAEAAGGLAVYMFLAAPGQNGIGPLNNVTTLGYAVFATTYGPRAYWNSMRDYQFTAALLLLILTAGLTLVAMAFQRRFAARYRGSITQ